MTISPSSRRTFGVSSFGAPGIAPGIATFSQGKPPAKFPGSVATDSDLIIAVDRQETSLAFPLNSTDTFMTVIDPAGIIAYCLLTIDSEIVKTIGPPVGKVVPIQRGFDGTIPSVHLAGTLVSGFIDAWHHNTLVSEIEAIENALGPNLANIPGSAVLTNSSYDFAPRSPGGSLTVGANSIALSPMPAGLAVGNYLYVSGGTGAAEAVQITGVSGGSIIVTCANTHSGAWTIQSATGGVQEAMVVAAASATFVTVSVIVQARFYAVANVPFRDAAHTITLQGQGKSTYTIVRDTTYRSGPLLFYNGTASNQIGFEVHDMAIIDGATDNTWVPDAGSAAIRIKNAAAGRRVIENVTIVGPNVGIDLDGSFAVEITNSMISWGTNPNLAPRNGIWIHGLNTILNNPGSIQTISDVHILGTQGATNYVRAGIEINSVDGCQIINSEIIQTTFGVLFSSNLATDQIDDVFLHSILIDGSKQSNVVFNGPGPAYVGDIAIRNCYMTMWPSTATPPATLESGIIIDATSKVQTLSIENNDITTSGHAGIEILATGIKKMLISGNRVTDCGVTGAGYSSIMLRPGVSNVLIQGNSAGNTGAFLGAVNYGISIDGSGGSTNISVVGNDFRGTAVGAIEIVTQPPANFVIGNNGGLDEVIPTVISAASIAAPVNPNFNVTGTATITTMTGGWAGVRKNLMKTDAGPLTVGGGGNIPGTHTLAQNQSITLTFNGTSWL